MTKEQLLNRLESKASFSFLKKDGTLRVVESATQNINLIPENARPIQNESSEPSKKKINNPDLISFYDFGVNAWRSCQFGQVVEILD